MDIFHADLDNTLIYSYKHDIGDKKICVELYEGREISFMTEKSYHLLQEISRNVRLIPTTTRTAEQYRRISLPVGIPEYALVCNGGILLKNGEPVDDWYQETRALIQNAEESLRSAQDLLQKDPHRELEVRNINDLFLFTKSREPQLTLDYLSGQADGLFVDFFHNGNKIYVMPKNLNKGNAVTRFRARMQTEEKLIAAGDSEFDVPMLEAADISIVPQNLASIIRKTEGLVVVSDGSIYSDGLLSYVSENS